MTLRLRAAAGLQRPVPHAYTVNVELLKHHRDLLASFDLSLDEQLLRQSSNVSQAELLERLLDADKVRHRRPDLLIVAYAVPDFWTTRITAAHANKLTGGCATSFAVSEQGLGAPFTALRIAAGFHAAGRCGTAVIAVLEQTTLAYRDEFVHGTPLIDSGALLVLDDAAGGMRFRRVLSQLTAAEMAECLAELSRRMDGADTLLVTGPWVDPGMTGSLPFERYVAPDGSYCTSVWLALARHQHDWTDAFGGVILCDFDPRSAQSYVAVLGREVAVRS